MGVWGKSIVKYGRQPSLERNIIAMTTKERFFVSFKLVHNLFYVLRNQQIQNILKILRGEY